MTDNRKNNFIIEDTSDEEESITSELDIPVEKIDVEPLDEIEDAKSNSLSSIQISDRSSSVLLSDNDYSLEEEYKNINCSDENFFTPECNRFQLKKEVEERNYLSEHEDENEYLYPNLNDKEFNIKIATKKEFNDTKYDGTIYEDIKKQADILAQVDFELQPHQAFVKNFMSFQTPYSSLLLYHGLGSGKTCSAIGVCEEMRDYMKQMGINKRIIIVASENVQDNFKLQLFDERKLKEINGVWTTRGCIGNKLLKEINPMNMPISKEKIISQIKTLINTYYLFLGYVQFANYIIKTMNYEEEIKRNLDRREIREKKTGEKREKTKIELLKDVKVELNSRVIRRLRNEFNNRLIVIDEVHNIRKSDNKENKKVGMNLELLVKAAQNMRFLFLSATPMYNNYKEIVWLLNLMNMNDRRGKMDIKDVFKANGEFKDGGEELLIRKATGYISFVRGENPYTFPYRVYPNEFSSQNTFPTIKYPSYQMNLKKIKHEDKKRILSLYLTKIGGCNNCGNCQYCCYKYIINTKRELPSFTEMDSFGYNMLQMPLESLIISYPFYGLKKLLDDIPPQRFSDDFSPSFSETLEEVVVEEEKEEPIQEVVVEEEKEEPIEEVVELTRNDIQKPIIGNDKKTRKLRACKYGERLPNGECPEKPKIKLDKPIEIVELNRNDKKTRKLRACKYGERLPNGECPGKPKIKAETQKIYTNNVSEIPEKSEREFDINIEQRSHQGIGTSRGGEKSSSSSDIRGIDPHQLTGKIGLERMMSFLDSKSPPIKGDFEYRPLTLKKYGKIFSQTEIGKYSAKIKSILDKIYDPDSKRVSDGIILIYSQYIDSGLIPVALALEEMGFTRFGEKGIKPLFKSRPTEVVDVRTMQPPEDKKNFSPARYSMITGDPRLSPNNDFEVKGLTGEDNKDGNKVKVVLISKAGSEGIDLKFIRQVHILDPWYNMNRPEQIIGRAVRNFSHSLLPFEKRNVQIFMHGTILDENIEESADLYVYRVAEFKAIQIGKVTRVLKETAVDCIINHDQTNFTQEIMSKSLKDTITQELSTGEVLRDFKIGDTPFSPSCDYMASCNYSCRPHAEIDETKLNEDTYDENFIVMNSEKILKRIRMLFKEAFFYKRDVLLKSIRTPKEYPYVQIYSALTQLIEDENEFIVDKYGRNGRLINIGEYYLFQPVELKDKNISIYERSVPLDFKHDMINFELKQDIVKPVIGKNDLDKMKIGKEEDKFPEGKRIFDLMKVNYNITIDYLKETKVPRGDDNWYKYCGIVIQKMAKEYPDSKKYLLQFLVAHMIELLLFEDKIHIMNYLYSLESIGQDTLERFSKTYFEKNSITTKNYTVFIGYKLNKRMIMILDDNNTWIAASPEEQREIASSKETKEFLEFNPNNYNTIIGFIGYEKGNKHLAFKTKNMTSKRDTGARCYQASKNINLAKLNEIIGENKYTIESTKAVKDKDGNIIQEAMGNDELCVLEEFILRYFNVSEENGKKWFFTPEMAIYHKLYTVLV
jgi:superfamily II DNA or RNA helicase/ferredoxin